MIWLTVKQAWIDEEEKIREEYIPISRAGNMVINRIRERRGLRSPAPTNPGRGLLVFARGRGWRPTSSSNVERPDGLPLTFGGEEIRPLNPLLTQELCNP